METGPAVSTTPNAAAAQVHWQGLLCKEGKRHTEETEEGPTSPAEY